MARKPKKRKSSARQSAAGRAGGGQAAQHEAERLIRAYRSGRLQEALDGAGAMTRRWPGVAVGWNVLAAAAQGLGRVEEAIDAYRRAASLEPANPGTRNNLGLLLLQQGRADEAIEAFRAALRHKPDFFEAAYNLALALENGGRLEAAEALCRDWLERRPDVAELHDRLGSLLAAQHRPEEALAAYQRAIDARPRHAGFRLNRGNLLLQLDRPVEAEAAYRAALDIDPDNLEILNNLCNLLKGAGRLEEAEALVRSGLERAPGRIDLLLQLAAVLREAERPAEAIETCRAAVEREPRNAEVHDALANALADAGDFDAAEAAYRQALSVRPHHARVVYQLATLRTPADPAAERARVEALLALDGWSEEDRAWLRYAAGKLGDDAGADPAGVFEHYRRGAAACRATFDYDVGDDERRLAAIAEAFPRERIARGETEGHDGTVPILIVGMPRSGTTLVERIVASHPRVHAGGERRDLGARVAELDHRHGRVFPHWADAVTAAELDELGAAYCRSLQSLAPAAERVTDKMPANFLYAGLAAMALPRVPILHVRRHPADTCLSCFTRRFASGHRFTYDLEELGRYYRAYAALTAHWRAVLPADRFLEVDYETLVTAPRATVERILAHCGLEWSEDCLAFHEHTGAVRTASADQVRQPLYRSAIGRWRRFEDELRPLLDALGPVLPADADG